MATITDNKNGSLMLLLDQVEQQTFAGLPAGQLEAYLTLWMKERATQVFQESFAKLAPQDQADVLAKFRDAGK